MEISKDNPSADVLCLNFDIKIILGKLQKYEIESIDFS